MKRKLCAYQETISILSQQKEAQIKLYKTREDNKLDKVIALENTVKEMVADLRYFNSLELELDSLRSQLEYQKTQFLNEIDRLSREYYNADHMNVILGVYTELDELVDIILFIVDFGCSKHMTGNLKLLINFVEKFLGTVKFGNDQIAPILGYGDLACPKRTSSSKGIHHQTSVARTPEQNGVVERRNRTLVEAARTM
nr:integrase, catalytic region, zinc finger, CCHC-type, peptidase aspartic, catalytic [Tanacetum cinerariifolium]GFA38810.1 integrase, catalytic region, zinc finger, CCHC-type, peptidase aspartic, catalytic [Tanacetum cinerariifolium]